MATIVITGATAGIGRAATMLLASKGHRVFACGRNEEALNELDGSSENITPVVLDVTDNDSVDAAANTVREHLHGDHPDALINNAGVAVVGPLEEVSIEEWDRQFQINVLGLVRVTKAFVAGMRESRRGRIINISSVAGRVTLPFFGPYNSTKHAVESISDSLRHELKPHNINVVVIEPGAVKTRFGALEKAQIDAHIASPSAYARQLQTLKAFHHDLHDKGADPVSVAGAIVDAVESDSPAPRRVVPLLPGSVFIAIKAWLPTRVCDWILRQLTNLP